MDVSDCEAPPTGDLVKLLRPNVLLDDAVAAPSTISYEILTRRSSPADLVHLGAPV